MAIQQKDMMQMIGKGDFKSIARALTMVENELKGASDLLTSLTIGDVPVIGITGPPGAGKSTLVNALTGELVSQNKSVAILAVDPTSPFNFGALLGDRIRMSRHFNDPRVFIRSMATRGALGGLSANVIEMLEVLKAANFDLIIIETVGVGQSEIDIAGIADQCVVVLVPEAGDEIQHIKSGLMEIAQTFVVNKADREGADAFANNITKLMRQQHLSIPVFKTMAEKGTGITALLTYLMEGRAHQNTRRSLLLADKAYKLIAQHRMRDVDRNRLHLVLEQAVSAGGFNLHAFVRDWISHS